MSGAPAPIRVAVAGLGFGAAVHVPGFRRIPGVEVCALAGNDRARTAECAAKLSIPVAASGYQALLDATPDAVSLALPPETGAKAAEFFLSRGIPVLAEKPLAGDGQTARRLADAARDRVSAVDFQFAELAAFRAARKILVDGSMGAPRHAHLAWLTESAANRKRFDTWKTSAAESGGVVSLLVSHAIYLVEWLLEPISTVRASLQRAGRRWTADETAAADTAHLLLGLRSGMVASAVISNASPGAHHHIWTVAGEEATLRIENATQDYMSGFHVEQWGREGTRVVFREEAPGNEDGRIAPFAALATRFIDCVRHGGKMTPSFEQGWRVQACLDAVQRSAARDQVISVA